MQKTVSAAVDRCHQQIEASTDPDTISAWAQVLAGLEVIVEYDERIEALEYAVANDQFVHQGLRERITALEAHENGR